MQRRPAAKAFLSGVTAASLGLMAGVLVDLTDTAIRDVLTLAIALAALVALMRTKINSTWLIGAGVAVGLVHALVA